MNAKVCREQHKEQLRRMILDAAREVFVKDGYESFTMRKLASAIEYSPGSIYLHFRNKEELFQAIIEEGFSHLVAEQERIDSQHPELHPVELLKLGLRCYIDFGLSHPNDYRLAFFLIPPQANRSQRGKSSFERLRNKVARCVEEGWFREVDIDLASQSLWCAIHGVTSLLIQRPVFPWADRESLISQVIHSAVSGLLPAAKQIQHKGKSH